VHLGGHVARVDGVDPDPAALQLAGPDPGHLVEAGLGDAVGAPARVADHPGVAGDIDHAPPPGGQHRPEQRPGEQERPHQVDGKDPAQRVRVGVEQVRHGRRPELGGVVDQHVDPVEGGEDRGRDPLDVVGVANIGGDRHHPGPERLGLTPDLFQRLGPAGHQGQVGPLAGIGQRHRPPQPPRGSGDQRDRPGQAAIGPSGHLDTPIAAENDAGMVRPPPDNCNISVDLIEE
jgi:hypothetical protein